MGRRQRYTDGVSIEGLSEEVAFELKMYSVIHFHKNTPLCVSIGLFIITIEKKSGGILTRLFVLLTIDTSRVLLYALTWAKFLGHQADLSRHGPALRRLPPFLFPYLSQPRLDSELIIASNRKLELV